MNATLYTPSGRFNPVVFALFLPTLAAEFVGAFVYSAIDIYSPIIGVITVLFTFGYGALIGGAMGLALRWGHVRNLMLMRGLAIFGGLFAVWSTWVAFFYIVSLRENLPISFFGLIFSPVGLWNLVLVVNESGYHGLKEWIPTGIFLWLAWGMEASILLVTSYTVTTTMANVPYCENCGVWMKKWKTAILIQPGRGFVDRILELDAKGAGSCSLISNGARHFERVSMTECPACSANRTITVDEVTVTINSKGQREEAVKPLLRHALVDAGFLESLLAQFNKQVTTT